MMNADTAFEAGLKENAPFSKDREQSHAQKTAHQNADASARSVRKRKWLSWRNGLVAAALAFVALTVIPFAFFAQKIATAEIPDTVSADAIVVLTGGQARVTEAVKLLEDGRAKRLLISGVHPGTTRKQLAAVTASPMPLEKKTVDLDRVALNTAGNAAETASWVRKNDFSSLLVVTSAYHLPRAAAELSGALPDVDLIGYPVFSKDLKLDAWYAEPDTMKLLMREYVKYIVARLRIAVQSVS
ncbi:MAG: YdcF family protein [Roseibium sp.]